LRVSVLAAAILFALCGCKGKESTDTAAGVDPTKPRIYELADVDKEMREADIQLESSPEDLRSFFKTHTNYQVCQDTSYMMVARMQNSKIDPKVHDEYIVAVYRDGKISNLEVGPPEFSVANLPSYCR
jgi:hypothetical protein